MGRNQSVSQVVTSRAMKDTTASSVDDTTVDFMQKTMVRVEKMRANTTAQQEKKEALRAGLTEDEKESVLKAMEEIEAAPPAQHLDHATILQEQVKLRNFKR